MPRRILADCGALTNTYGDIDMASLSLTFHETTFNIVECDQQAWITSRQLGQALGMREMMQLIKYMSVI